MRKKTIFFIYSFIFFDWCFSSDCLIWIKTCDQKIILLEKWKIDEIEVVKSLLLSQRNENSKTNPIRASMCTSSEIALLSRSFDLICSDKFEQLSQKNLKKLTDIAIALEAIGILVLCSLSNNIARRESFFIKTFEKIKKYCNRVEYYSLDADSVAVIPYLNTAVSADGTITVSVSIDCENNNHIKIIDQKSEKSKEIVVDDCIVCGECLRRPINKIAFDPGYNNRFIIECFGYLGKLIVYESGIDRDDFTFEHIQFLYKLYLAVMSGKQPCLQKNSQLLSVYENLSENAKKMVGESFDLEFS